MEEQDKVTGEHAADAVAIYVPPSVRQRALLWGSLASDVRRRRSMAAAAEHDGGELADIAVAFLLLRGRQHAAASDHTVRAYATGVRALLGEWTQENLLHPSPDAGDRYVQVLSEHHTPSTCSARLAAAIALYRGLRWSGATTADPFSGVKAPRERTARHERRHPYSDAQVSAIAAVSDERLRLLILLTAHAGLRIAEAQALRWVDVHEGNMTLRVVCGKGRKARTVHLSFTLVEALKIARHLVSFSGEAVVIRKDGQNAIDASWLRRRLGLACAAAGVEYLGWHAFRHTAGTRLARESGNLQLVAAHLGHADIATAAIYAKWSDQTLADQISTW